MFAVVGVLTEYYPCDTLQDPWINILTKTAAAAAAARRRSRSLELTGTPCSPLHEAGHFSDLMCSEHDRGPSKSGKEDKKDDC